MRYMSIIAAPDQLNQTCSLILNFALSSICGMVFCGIGLWISYLLNMASGAVIVVISVAGYFTAYCARIVLARIRRNNLVPDRENQS